MIINLNGHPFTLDQLQTATAGITIPDGKHAVVVGTVDNNGESVALVVGLHDNDIHIKAAFDHTLSGDNEFGGQVSVAF